MLQLFESIWNVLAVGSLVLSTRMERKKQPQLQPKKRWDTRRGLRFVEHGGIPEIGGLPEMGRTHTQRDLTYWQFSVDGWNLASVDRWFLLNIRKISGFHTSLFQFSRGWARHIVPNHHIKLTESWGPILLCVWKFPILGYCLNSFYPGSKKVENPWHIEKTILCLWSWNCSFIPFKQTGFLSNSYRISWGSLCWDDSLITYQKVFRTLSLGPKFCLSPTRCQWEGALGWLTRIILFTPGQTSAVIGVPLYMVVNM